MNFDDNEDNFDQVPDGHLQKFTKFGGFGAESYNREDHDCSSGMDMGPQIQADDSLFNLQEPSNHDLMGQQIAKKVEEDELNNIFH